jgi:hypothetical protein
MSVAVDFKWVVSPSTLGGKAGDWGKQIWAGLLAIAERFAQSIAAAAKSIAPWQDITGAARQGLVGFTQSTATSVTIFVVTSVFYGIFLEMGTRNMGPRPAILPAMESQYGALMAAMRSLVGG